MIQISEGAALTPQEWQNLAINSVHHKDTREKNKTKNHLATTATVATAIIPANDIICADHTVVCLYLAKLFLLQPLIPGYFAHKKNSSHLKLPVHFVSR